MTKIWTLQFTDQARKKLKKFDSIPQKRILKFLTQKLLVSEDPRLYGKALTGRLSSYWSYRVGDYRILVDIRDNDLLIWAVDIDHRSVVYF